MTAIERYEELYKKAVEQADVRLAFTIACELTQEERRKAEDEK